MMQKIKKRYEERMETATGGKKEQLKKNYAIVCERLENYNVTGN